MKLLFLYIENFRVHQYRSFSFDSCLCFDYNPGTRMLTCHRAEEGSLADDFFAVREKAKSRVDSVSAIIGENGSGKTTIATALGEAMAPAEKERTESAGRCLLVYSKDEYDDKGSRIRTVYYCVDNLEETIRDDQPQTVIREPWYHVKRSLYQPFTEDEKNGFGLVYYSPHYSLQRVFFRETDRVRDLSTAAMMRRGVKESGDGSYKSFETAELMRLLGFISRTGLDAGSMKNEDIPLPCPGDLHISANRKVVMASRHHLVSTSIESLALKPTIRYDGKPDVRHKAYLLYGRVMDLCLIHDPFWGIVANLFAIWSKRDFYPYAEPNLLKLDEVVEWWLKVGQRCLNLVVHGHDDPSYVDDMPTSRFRDFWEKKSLDAKTWVKKKVLALMAHGEWYHFRGVTSEMRKLHAAFMTLLRGVAELQQDSDDAVSNQMPPEDENEVTVKVRSRKHRKILYKILAASDKLRQLNEENRHDNHIEVRPGGMSSGEMAFLSMLSRIDEILGRRGPLGKDVVLFLDEAETALHPAWQRQLVNTLIWYVERFTKELHVHIVAASHSPLLLSDIPAGNVCLLDGDGMDGRMHVRTFGANIFDLYRVGFKMEEGAWGGFARNKMKDLIAKVNTGIPFSDADRKVLPLIGDALIRGFLEKYDRQMRSSKWVEIEETDDL